MDRMKLVFSDLYITVEQDNVNGSVHVTGEIPDAFWGRSETSIRTEVYYGYSYVECVEDFGEKHRVDLWDSIDAMREEIGELADVGDDD